MSSPAVSVIIPCHNAAEFVGDALQSVRDQTLDDFECIVVDDSSTDGSAAIVERFAKADPRFRLILLSEGHGASAARNAGIAEASGRWLAPLDADDLFLQDRLELLTGIGDEHRADLVVDDQIITAFPNTISTHHAFGFTQPTFPFSQEDYFTGSRLFRRSFPMGYMKPLIRREFVSKTAVAYDPSVPSGEDFLFYAHLFAQKLCCIGTCYAGYIYRRRRGSLSWSEEHLRFHSELGDRVLRELGSELSPRSRSALAGRRRDFEDVAKAMPALAALRARNWIRLASILIQRPSVAPTCLRLLHTRGVRTWSRLKAAATGGSRSNSAAI
ncbi:MAG TPA: glycosyltransferase family 2 protein [Sphingomicrobium sp.]|nr:glycosyltransferase family 2 protein [Sphingomicrobium sp.]